MRAKRRDAMVIATVLVMAAVRSAPAQQVPRDTVELEDLVATATRVPVAPGSLSAAVTTLSGDDLRAQGIRFVSDALREVPGASIVSVGSYGGVTSLFLRGGESDYVKVLVDGVAVNLPGGAFDFSGMTTDNVDRIEVVRGPTSVLYGSDAMTGVIQIFTRRGHPGVDAGVGATAGSFGSTSVGGRMSGASGGGGVSFAVAGSRFATDGTGPFNSTYGNAVGSAMVRTALGRQSHATLSARFTDNSFHFPTDGAGVPSDSNQFTFDHSWVLGLEVTRRFGPRVTGVLALARYMFDGGFEDRQDHPGDTLGFAFASTRATSVTRQTVDARFNVLAMPELLVTAGTTVDIDRERQGGDLVSNFGAGIDRTQSDPLNARRRNIGLYLQGLLELPVPATMQVGARLDENDAFGSFVTYRAGVVYRFSEAARVRASVGTGFKAPTFAEMFADAAFEIGNPALDPERSRSWEIGAEYRAWGGLVTLWADYFDQRFRDLVQYTFSEPGLPTYRNLPRALARGVEAGAVATLRSGFTLSGQYTYLDSETTDPGADPASGTAFELGRPLLRRPAHSVQGAASAQMWRGSSAALRLNHVGARDDLAFDDFTSIRVELPAYTTLDVSARFGIVPEEQGRPGITASVRVENALDESYDTVTGFPGRGRAVTLGVVLQF